MTNYSKHYIVSGITARLFDIIKGMPEEEQHDLLISLSKGRKHSRKPYIMPIDYRTKDGSFRDFMIDISVSGVFIETNKEIPIGEDLLLNFSDPNTKESIKLRGKVVRKTPIGVGVKFDNISEDKIEILKSFLKLKIESDANFKDGVVFSIEHNKKIK